MLSFICISPSQIMLPEALLASEEFKAEWDVLLHSAILLSMGEVFYHRLLRVSQIQLKGGFV